MKGAYDKKKCQIYDDVIKNLSIKPISINAVCYITPIWAKIFRVITLRRVEPSQ